MDISIVIPTFNRSRLLRQTLPSLTSQRADGFEYEVIFVNNGSSDETPEVLKEAAARWPGKVRCYHLPPTGGPSAPRNVGIRQAKGGVVIIIDDDVQPEPDLAAAHMAFHRLHPEPNWCALGEAYVPEELRDDQMTLFHDYPYDAVRKLDRLSFLNFWTCNVSAKRQFLMDAGLFNEDFLCYEDVILGYELDKRGMTLRFLPEARGKHLHQMNAAAQHARGAFFGHWLHPFVERYPDGAIKYRFGLLSPSIGMRRYLRRLVNRGLFWMIDTRPVMGLLESYAGNGRKRNRLTDLYHYVPFRRNMLAGYREARKEHLTAAQMAQRDRLRSAESAGTASVQESRRNEAGVATTEREGEPNAR